MLPFDGERDKMRDKMIEIGKVYEYRSMVAEYVEQSMARLAIIAETVNIDRAAQIDSSFRLDTGLLRHALEQSIVEPVLQLLGEGYTVALPTEQEAGPAESILPEKHLGSTLANRYLLAISGIDPLTDTWSVVTGTHAPNVRSQRIEASVVPTKTLVSAIRGPIQFNSFPPWAEYQRSDHI